MDTMEKIVEIQIEEMRSGCTCPKDFVCYKSNFRNLCKAKDIGLESFVICLVRDPLECKFAILFGDVSFCTCPVRIYIAKNLKK
jgi:hypothetical protein